MLTDTLPRKQNELLVPEQALEVVLTDDSADPLALILPPHEELAAIARLKGTHVTVRELVDVHESRREEAFRDELERAKSRLGSFADSAVFLNRLANLARASGDLDLEGHYLAQARRLSPDKFYASKYGDSLLIRGDTQLAEELFRGLAGGNDAGALLRLAAIHVRRQELAQAMELVRRAVELDPVDFSARLFEGGLHLAAGALERAIHCFRLAASERPTSSVVSQNLAVAYLRLGQPKKSYAMLKRAVALNPLNETALFLLADQAHHENRDEDVIAQLRYYLEFEQASAPGWARLARACIQKEDTAGALVALRRQASIEATPVVWNNIGVVRALQNDLVRAAEAFKYAIGRASVDGEYDAMLAARNLAQTLLSARLFDELARYAGGLIAADGDGAFRRSDVLSDIYVFYLHALRIQGRAKEVEVLAESVLTREDAAPQLAAWALGSLVGYYSLHEGGGEKAMSLIERWFAEVEARLEERGPRKAMLLNNVAFALAEAGRLAEAEVCLGRIHWALHREPFPTATLGLIDLKKGNAERGIRRYREAISLARTRVDKTRIRQKLALELGRMLASLDASRSRRHLERAATQRGGEESIAEQARRQLRALSDPK